MRTSFGHDYSPCEGDAGRTVITESGQHRLVVYGHRAGDRRLRHRRRPGARPTGWSPSPGRRTSLGRSTSGAHDVYQLDLQIGDAVSITPQGACASALRYGVRSPSDALPLGFDRSPCEASGFTATEIGVHELTLYGLETATGPYQLRLELAP